MTDLHKHRLRTILGNNGLDPISDETAETLLGHAELLLEVNTTHGLPGMAACLAALVGPNRK